MLNKRRQKARWAYVLWGTGVVFLCIVSAAIGGLLTRNFNTQTYDISYADFISVMLTAVSLLMTVLAIFLAIVGFVGWTSIEQKVHSKTEEILSQGFEKGEALERLVSERVTSIMYEGIDSLSNDASEEQGMRPKTQDKK